MQNEETETEESKQPARIVVGIKAGLSTDANMAMISFLCQMKDGKPPGASVWFSLNDEAVMLLSAELAKLLPRIKSSSMNPH